MKRVAIITVLIVLMAPTQAISALSWSNNLLINPGAETGQLDPWTYGSHVVVSQSEEETTGWVYPHSGDWFFNMHGTKAGVLGSLVADAIYQDVDVSSYAVDIDAGMFMVQAHTWLQTEDSDAFPTADYAQLTVCFLNQSGVQIGALSTGLVQSPNLTWIEQTLDGRALVGTRTLRIELLGEMHEGTWINTFFDNASIKVAVVPAPGALLLGSVGTGLVVGWLRRRRAF